jgi:tetratricopeptide (TPR) repeat protein
MMNRFPLLKTYRLLLILTAILVTLCGICWGVSLLSGAEQLYDLMGQTQRDLSTGEKISTFLTPVLCALGLAFMILLVAEGIKLAVNIESHLYDIRSDIRNTSEAGLVTSPSLAGGSSRRTTSGKRPGDESEKSGRLLSRTQGRLPATSSEDEYADVLAPPKIPRTTSPSSFDPSSLPDPFDELERQQSGNEETNKEQAQELYREGLRLYKAEDYKAAIVKFDEVIQLDPNHADAFGLRGMCYKNLGDVKRATQDIKIGKGLKGT